jgi:hypothetical protein
VAAVPGDVSPTPIIIIKKVNGRDHWKLCRLMRGTVESLRDGYGNVDRSQIRRIDIFIIAGFIKKRSFFFWLAEKVSNV